MVFFLIILLFIMIKTAHISKPDEFQRDYISRENSNVIKGIFVILIVFSHASQYITLQGIYDEPYMILRDHLNQMVVAMFFFYSGFGMMKSILAKKFSYVKNIPGKRFLVNLIHFDIAVVLFLILQLILGKTFSVSTILLSFIGWESVGNSNWYMFAIFSVYLMMFLAFYLIRWLDKPIAYYVANVIMTALLVLFVFWEIRMGQPAWCYNTVILFSLGSWYAMLQRPIEKIMMKNDRIYSFLCALLLFIYYVSYRNRWSGGIERYTIWAVAFTIMVVFFTMKITFHSRILLWFGEHIFSVYILQRIPMLLLSRMGIAAQDKYAFLILSILAVIVLAIVFDSLVEKLDKKLIKIVSR